MGRVTSTSYSSTTNTTGHSQTQSQSQSKSQSTTQKMIDEKLRDQILAGLMGYMTDEEIGRYAENLLRQELDARLEAAQQTYDTAKLGREQEMEGLAAALTRSIADQERIYAKNAAGVQTAALARGMGRSSYTLQALANEGREHAPRENPPQGDAAKTDAAKGEGQNRSNRPRRGNRPRRSNDPNGVRTIPKEQRPDNGSAE